MLATLLRSAFISAIASPQNLVSRSELDHSTYILAKSGQSVDAPRTQSGSSSMAYEWHCLGWPRAEAALKVAGEYNLLTIANEAPPRNLVRRSLARGSHSLSRRCLVALPVRLQRFGSRLRDGGNYN